MPAAGFGQQKGLNSPQQPPTAHRTTNTSKVEQIGLQSFASSARMGFPGGNSGKESTCQWRRCKRREFDS